MAQTYELITSTTLGSAQATVTLTSIPSTYTDLILVVTCYATGGGGGSIRTKVNSDGSTLYNTTYFYGDGSSVTPGQTGDTNTGLFMGRMNGYSTEMGGGLIHIPNYATTTTFKNMTCFNFGRDMINWFASGTYRSTNAITSIYMDVESSANFDTGSTFYLYGIKAG